MRDNLVVALVRAERCRAFALGRSNSASLPRKLSAFSTSDSIVRSIRTMSRNLHAAVHRLRAATPSSLPPD